MQPLIVPAVLLAGLWGFKGDDPKGEGPLNNDTALFHCAEAEEALLQGDRAWQRALIGGSDRQVARGEAFEGWRKALVDSVNGDAVQLALPHSEGPQWEDPDRTHARRSEGVSEAVLRRLLALPIADRVAWQERIHKEAEGLLATSSNDSSLLARVERNTPLTPAATQAALRLADRSLERGRIEDTRTWLRRAERHAATLSELAEETAPLRASLALRQEVLASLDPAERHDQPHVQAYQAALALKPTLTARLESTQVLSPQVRPTALGRSVISGGAFLTDGTLFVQTPRGVALFRDGVLHGRGGERKRRHTNDELLGLTVTPPYALPSAGGWPLLPSTTGMDAIVVVGRGRGGRVVGNIPLSAKGNHVVCLHLAPGGRLRVRWRLSQEGLYVPNQELTPWDEALDLPGRFEFQPGPVVVDGRVFVQARGLTHPDSDGVLQSADLWLLALDHSTGQLIWKRPLARPSDLRRRGSAGNDVPTTAMPLAVEQGVVVAGTNMGVTLALDALDGRQLWSFRTRRRGLDSHGWPGSRPPSITGQGDNAQVIFAPYDSDRLYCLALRPRLGQRILRRAVIPQGSLIDVAGAALDEEGLELVFLGRDGRHQALRSLDAQHELRSSLYLGVGERFTGQTLLSSQRAYAASNRGLYLFDRDREYYLQAMGVMESIGAGVGGNVVARGDIVAVTGHDSLWVFQTH